MTSAAAKAWRRRRADIVARYGSADAATAPCEREKLLLAAVEPWRTKSEEWTVSVDGWRGSSATYREMPEHALRAIKDAFPLPESFSEAKAEDSYWRARNEELRDMLSEDGTFAEDVALDLVAEVRAAIVSDLALFELPVTTLADLHSRMVMSREAGIDDFRVGAAVFRDVQAMAAAVQAQPSTAQTDTPTAISDRIRSVLSADPSQSDRSIARMLRCSPTTVGAVRASLGLRLGTCSVSRGGKRFEMHHSGAQRGSS